MSEYNVAFETQSLVAAYHVAYPLEGFTATRPCPDRIKV